MKPALAFLVMFSLALVPGTADAGKRCEAESAERDGSEGREGSAWHSHHGDGEIDIDFDLFGWEEDEDETRLQILDLAIFSLVDVRSKEPDYSHVEILEAPLVTAFERRQHPDEQHLRILDVPFFSLYESRSEGDESEIGVINLWPIGSLYSQEIDGKKKRQTVLFLLRFETPVASSASRDNDEPEPEPDGGH